MLKFAVILEQPRKVYSPHFKISKVQMYIQTSIPNIQCSYIFLSNFINWIKISIDSQLKVQFWFPSIKYVANISPWGINNRLSNEPRNKNKYWIFKLYLSIIYNWFGVLDSIYTYNKFFLNNHTTNIWRDLFHTNLRNLFGVFVNMIYTNRSLGSCGRGDCWWHYVMYIVLYTIQIT